MYERTTKFTLFFIPLFTTSRSYLVECVDCGASYPVEKKYTEDVVEEHTNNENRARIVSEYEALHKER